MAKLDQTSAFPPTQWSLIAAAGGPAREEALSRLYQIYWKPLCAQARRFGVRAEEAEDVAQDVFVSLSQSGTFGRADVRHGRFRSYLLGALRNHLSHHRARQQALKRGGADVTVSIDSVDPPATSANSPVDAREFDTEWAGALLAEALRRFQSEMHQGGNRVSFEVLGSVVLGDAQLSCEEAARQLHITVPAVKSRIFRLRRRFQAIVREEVQRTVSSESECEDELRYLCSVLEKMEAVGPLAGLA